MLAVFAVRMARATQRPHRYRAQLYPIVILDSGAWVARTEDASVLDAPFGKPRELHCAAALDLEAMSEKGAKLHGSDGSHRVHAGAKDSSCWHPGPYKRSGLMLRDRL